jgi:hypothetical protein
LLTYAANYKKNIDEKMLRDKRPWLNSYSFSLIHYLEECEEDLRCREP